MRMRMRMLVAGALVVAGAIVLVPGMASAQTNSNNSTSSTPTTAAADTSYANEAAADCAKLLNEGKKVDDCQKAPSPIIPEVNELIWGTISFTVLFLLLWKFAWPGLKQMMETRTERIRDDLSAAELAKSDAEQALDEYKAQLQDARNESARIIEEARQQADALRREQEQRLQTELAEMRERAAADVESAKQQAVADLRRDVATLAIGAAEIIVQRSLDRPTQEQLVDNYIAQVASRAN